MPLAGRRHGRAHRAHHAGRERAGAHGPSLPAGHAPPLWDAGMAGHAAPARGRGRELGISAVLELIRSPDAMAKSGIPHFAMRFAPLMRATTHSVTSS